MPFGTRAIHTVVTYNLKKATTQSSTFGFANTQANTEKPKELKFSNARIEYSK